MANFLQKILKKVSSQHSCLGMSCCSACIPRSGEMDGWEAEEKIPVHFLLQLGFSPEFRYCFLLQSAYVRYDELGSTNAKISCTYREVKKRAGLFPLLHPTLSSLVGEETLIPVYSSDEQMWGGISSHRGLKKETDLVRFFQRAELSQHKGWCVVGDGAADVN